MKSDIPLPNNTFSFAKQAAFKSQAQRRKFYAMMNDGEISPEVVKEWEDDTPKNIPERIEKTANMFGHLAHAATSGIGSLLQGTSDAASSIMRDIGISDKSYLNKNMIANLINQAKQSGPYYNSSNPYSLNKFAGGPGSGVKGDNTKPIDMPLTPYITIMKRKAFMNSKEPFLKNRLIEMDNIKFVGQEKYTPAKLNNQVKMALDKNAKDPLQFPIDVTLLPNGDYAVLDGHHRFLTARKLKKSAIKANVYTVTKEDKQPKQQLQKVAFSPSKLTRFIPDILKPSSYATKNVARAVESNPRPKLETLKDWGKGAYNLAFGGRTQGDKWDPLFGLKSMGRAREKVTKGPTKGMYKYDQYGDHVYDMNKKRDWLGYLKDEFSGASRTRADLAAKKIAKKKGMNVGEYMSQAGPKQHQRLKDINNMKVRDFIEKHPALAANYYGRNALQKGMVVGFPAYTAYDLVSGNTFKNNPDSSKLGNTLGSLTEGIGWGITGPLGVAGAMASSMGAGALARKVGNTIQAPPPQPPQPRYWY